MNRKIPILFVIASTLSLILGSCASLTPEQLALRDSEYKLALQDVAIAKQSSGQKSATAVQNALAHFHEAAKLDHTKALYAIGDFYSGGHFTSVNWPEAISWYKKAANSGGFFSKDFKETNILACKQLALSYYEGRPGVGSSRRESLKWAKKGGNLGDADLQAFAGYLILESASTLDDYQDALNWLNRAGSNGHHEARRDAKRLKSEILKNMYNNIMGVMIQASSYSPTPMDLRVRGLTY